MINEAVIIVMLGAFLQEDRGRVNGNAIKALVVLLFDKKKYKHLVEFYVTVRNTTELHLPDK